MATTESLKSNVLVQQEQPPANPRRGMTELVVRMRDEYGKALAGSISPDRFVRVATSELARNPQLAECGQESFLGALMTAAQLGLEPGPLGLYWLTPRRVKGQWQCVGIIGWKGYRELAYRASRTVLSAEEIRARDTFHEVRGAHPDLIHEPPPLGQDRGELVGFYAVAHIPKAAVKPHVVMSKAEVDAWRDKYAQARGQGPWAEHYEAMGRKTVIRRLMALVPQTDQFGRAIGLDDRPRLVLPGGARDEVLDDPADDIQPGGSQVPDGPVALPDGPYGGGK